MSAINLFIGLLLHFVGDYLLQTTWMATEKTKKHLPALVHASVYSLPFLFIADFKFWLIIWITHFFIDRYRLAIYWIKLINRNPDSNNYGYDENTPVWLSTWLLFITDNTWHILINSVCIYLSLKY